jgi:sugar phosphate isomerase/epimerase
MANTPGGVDMMKYGISSDTFVNESLDTILPLVKEFGVKYIELWGSNLEMRSDIPIHKYVFSDKNIKKAEKQLEKAGCRVSCLTYGIGNDPDYYKDLDAYKREFNVAIETASYFGAKVINHYSTNICKSIKPDFDLLHRYWDEAVEKAESAGIVLALENEAMDVTCLPENVLMLIEEFNSPSFKTNFDATNYYHSGNEAFPYAYDLLKDHIAYVHIKNGRRYIKEFCPDPGWIGVEPFTQSMSGNLIYYTKTKDGVLNMHGLLRQLAFDGYEGFCTLEPHTTRENSIEAIMEEISYMKCTGLFED